MEGHRLIRRITLQNILSFGAEEQTVDLEPLNVLIGPNGSGKSNLLHVLKLLRAMASDLSVPIREGGGINEWLWKGEKNFPTAFIQTELSEDEDGHRLCHNFKVQKDRNRFEVFFESISLDRNNAEKSDVIYIGGDGEGSLNHENLENLKSDQSILSQVRDPARYPALYHLHTVYSQLIFYFMDPQGDKLELRAPQSADLPEDFLLEDGTNFGLILNDLDHRRMKDVIVEQLKKFYEPVIDITTKIFGGQLMVYIHENGLSRPTPATRLSDGTLSYLRLLLILCHPEPPGLICIEEPELGLHPDILPVVARLLIEASQRTQLIVTTHSDILVSALSDVPEAILVCERDEKGTHLRRLDPDRLRTWLEDYSLGELWRSGEIGGNRW